MKTQTSHTPTTIAARLPSNLLLTYELGDQLPSVEYQPDVKRVIRLPGNVTHTTEWLHQLRHDDGYHGNRRTRPDTTVRRLLVCRSRYIFCHFFVDILFIFF